MELFLQTIEQFTPLSPESKTALSVVLRKQEWRKGHTLIKRDTVCHYIYFIEKGLTRTYYYKDEKDITDWISYEGTFAGSMISFLTRQPDRRTVELLEDSVLYAIHYNDLEALYKHYHDIERLGRLLTAHAFVLMQQRFDDLHFASASERYQKLIYTNPTLLKRVPLGMIATYLGITQETLSRIRARYQFF